VYAQKSNDAAASSAAAYTQRRLSYCAFFRNDPAPRAIALSISMPEAFTDFNSTRRMPRFRVHMFCWALDAAMQIGMGGNHMRATNAFPRDPSGLWCSVRFVATLSSVIPARPAELVAKKSRCG
jgi:hypothetical protein